MSEIVKTEDTLGGKPRVKGTRVSAEQIYEMHLSGKTIEEIAELLPTINKEDTEAAIKYMERQEDTENSTITA